MNFNQMSSKLPKLIQNQDQNSTDIYNKISPIFKSLPISTNLAPHQVLYDSEWNDIPPEDIPGASSQVENMELPQKVPFEFTTNLEVPEVYLPFVNIAVLTKPIGNQKVIGAGGFVYTGLREVLLQLYGWQGITSSSSFLGTIVEFSDGSSIPTKPAPNIPFPPVATCYIRTSYFQSVSVVAAASITFTLEPDGLHVVSSHQSTTEAIQGFLDTYGIGENQEGTLTWSFGQEYHFNHDIIFPVPIDGQSDVPCGDTEVRMDNQYWLAGSIVTFENYLLMGHTYAEAKELFATYYPNIFITPEDHGHPYKCYQIITSTVVESGNLKIKIVKTDNKNFQYSVYGNILLVSPAIEETEFSDEDFPTYQPNSNLLAVRLLVTFKDHPVNYIQTQMGRQ